jgi:hypothetical protein
MKNSLLAITLLAVSSAVGAQCPGHNFEGQLPQPTFAMATDGTLTLTSSRGNTIIITPAQAGPGVGPLTAPSKGDLRRALVAGGSFTMNGQSVKFVPAPMKVQPKYCGGTGGGYSESWNFGDYNASGFSDDYSSNDQSSGPAGDTIVVAVAGVRDPDPAFAWVSYNIALAPADSSGGGTTQQQRDSCRADNNIIKLVGAVGCTVMLMRNVPGAVACGTIIAIGTAAIDVECDNLP